MCAQLPELRYTPIGQFLPRDDLRQPKSIDALIAQGLSTKAQSDRPKEKVKLLVQMLRVQIRSYHLHFR